jgi:hypothetical protein
MTRRYQRSVLNVSSPEPAQPRQGGRREYHKHGLYYYQRLLSGDGLKKSTALYHALREKEEELIAALGSDPSPQERAIIADSVKNILYIGSLDNYLMTLKSLIRKSRPHPVLAIRTQMSAHLRENLKTLGLKRVPRELAGLDLARRLQYEQQQKKP